ncbi:MAG: class I SAM-dependent methyltransferase [Oscillospiraceae bacterium]|nr:class I SAM-dependent methyltransferase [Oscillospiraceae bacterium]
MYDDTFAGVYDRLMEDTDYHAWAEHYAALFRQAGLPSDPRLVRALDAACGTGNMTLALHALGYRMTGADRSVEMLAVASEKSRSRGIAIPFIRQDMRSLAVHRPMDAVVCACDGVNYMLTDDDARRFFTAARRALKPGGGLFFDISSAYKLERTLGGRCIGEDRGDIVFLWRNEYNPLKRVIAMDLTFFTREPDDRYRASRETHIQRAHDADRIIALLKDCGFKNARAFGEMSLYPPEPSCERIHFAAVRED